MELSLVTLPSYIRKPTALIHFERELSVVAQKVMTLIVSHCQKATKNAQGFYLIEKREVCEFLGWEESHNYPRVVEAFREIFNNTVVWNLFGQDRTFKRLECKLIIALLIPTETGRFVGFRLYPELEPVIQSPKVFGQILLEVPALLTRSEYAFPLYELLADHVSREDGSLRISLADLKRYLGLKGRYPVFQMFKVRALIPSLDSINASTDLQVRYETWKRGQAVGGLIFHVQRESKPARSNNAPGKTLTVLTIPPEAAKSPEVTTSIEAIESAEAARSPEEQHLLDRLAEHHISRDDALLAVQTHGLMGAMDILGYVRQEVAQRKGTAKEVRNVPAYLAQCLREGYGLKSDAEREAEAEAARQAEQVAAAQVAQEQARHQQNTDFKARSAEAVTQWLTLSEAQQAVLEQRFLQEEPIWRTRPTESITRIKAFERWLTQQWL